MRHMVFSLIILSLASLACCRIPLAAPTPQSTPVSRQAALADAHKMTPDEDALPPVIAPGWSQPVPLGEPINTAGGEDSPFVSLDGQTLYFFFTPDIQLPANQQVSDGVTGIWASQRSGQAWTEPQRVVLAEPGQPHLDGCPFVRDDQMIFCSIREGNRRSVDLYTATCRDGAWTDWRHWSESFATTHDVGELHITADGRRLYFASERAGGLGGLDLWVSEHVNGRWQEPVHMPPPINSAGDENRPFVTADGQELWFDSASHKGLPGPGIFRSVRQADGSWGDPEEIVSSFAGEPTLTSDGQTLYFVHHYLDLETRELIESDIYVTTRLAD